MRDAIYIPINDTQELVITTDNSGAIGLKEDDAVQAPYETVSYYLFRVAMMENLATGATPLTVVLQNFSGDDVWDNIVKGVRQGLQELGMEDIKLTGSTESNFPLKQSALGLNVIGKKSTMKEPEKRLEHVALIGQPLVGNEVIIKSAQVAPLSICKQLSRLSEAVTWPVGSKGILAELEQMLPGQDFKAISDIAPGIDLKKSGGPATAFLIAYPAAMENKIKEITGDYFTKLK